MSVLLFFSSKPRTNDLILYKERSQSLLLNIVLLADIVIRTFSKILDIFRRNYCLFYFIFTPAV